MTVPFFVVLFIMNEEEQAAYDEGYAKGFEDGKTEGAQEKFDETIEKLNGINWDRELR